MHSRRQCHGPLGPGWALPAQVLRDAAAGGVSRFGRGQQAPGHGEDLPGEPESLPALPGHVGVERPALSLSRAQGP